jgi:hypothetical protein
MCALYGKAGTRSGRVGFVEMPVLVWTLYQLVRWDGY